MRTLLVKAIPEMTCYTNSDWRWGHYWKFWTWSF